jgi:hypothetical protein
MARRPNPASRGVPPQPPKKRAVSFSIDGDTAEIIEELSGALGVTQTEVIERAIAILAAEMSKMAMIMPAWMDDDEDDDE